MKDETIVGHLPQRYLECALFLRRGGTIHCVITGGRRYSRDLPRGGV